MGHHGVHGKGNGTFPLNMFEEAVKVPFIARCPGRIPAGVVNDDLVSHYDFMPTILDYLGMERPEGEKLPGRSFADILSGAGNGGHEEVVICDEYGPTRMIRDREWKYVHRYPYGPHELYCLAEDPREERNLVDEPKYDEIATRLRGRLDEWFVEYAQASLDGARQGVTGKGQIDAVGPAGGGRTAFV